MAHARPKTDAVPIRAGLAAVTCEVRIVRAAARHGDRPWTAKADQRVGDRTVVVTAEEATGQKVGDRLRRQTDRPPTPGRRAAGGGSVVAWR